MTPPVGMAEVRQFYGDPDPFLRADGTPSTFWELKMVLVPFPSKLPLGWNLMAFASAARVNEVIASEAEMVFRLLDKEGLWPKFRTYDGGYTWRMQRNAASTLSLHAFGGALDFDAGTNRTGRRGDMDLGIVRIFESCGWTWGGRFARPDGMHFQWARSV